jgi:endo-1,4-beta-xylanase
MMIRRRFLKAASAVTVGLASTACQAAGLRVPAPPPLTTPAASSIPKKPNATALPDGLRALADARKLRFGSAFSGTLFNSDKQQQVLDIYRRDFNLATLHSGFYWSAWEEERGKISPYQIDQMKRQAEALQRAGITDLRGHPLIFPTLEPQWLIEGLKSGKIKKVEAIDIVTQHIRDMMTPFIGIIKEWVVVNEPFRFYGADRGDYFKLVIGEDYVDMAFQTAREVDPQAKLLLNDYDTHAKSGRGTRYESDKDPIIYNKALIDRLKAKGLVDGIGTQMHISAAKPPKADDLIETFRGYGLPVHITELDVNLKDSALITNRKRFEQQAQVYADMLQAALQSGVCESVCLWEFGDKYSWLEDSYFSFASPDADATPWGDALKPKPAYDALRQTL